MINEEQSFILTHAHTLRAAGYDGELMNDLALDSEHMRNFVVMHRKAIHAAGYEAGTINYLAQRESQYRNNVMQMLGIRLR